jgi:protein TonB
MFETTLAAQSLSESDRRYGSLSAAVAGHLAVVLAIAGIAAMIVPPVKGPDLPLTIIIPPVREIEPFRLEAPRPPKRGTRTALPAGPVEPRETPAPRADAPPDATPPVTSTEPTAEGPPGSGVGPVGDPDGSDLGVTDGEKGGAGEGDGDGPVYVTGDMVKPQLLVKVEPTYPEVARIARLGGRVTVKAIIGLKGDVESAEVFSSTSPLFNQAALEAIRRWRYRPALMGGRPVRVYFTVAVEFSIR